MAADKAEDELKSFLSYMNGEEPKTVFTQQIEMRVKETKQDEEKRREYMLLQSFEMDARRAGIQQGIQQGISNAKRETASALKQMGLAVSQIVRATGLSTEEIKAL